ncbi:hypothetical protein PENTCL1PPCAC_13295, partial [Pristionchus entomophagus]
QSTTGSEFPGGQLVNMMNELLRAVVDTNFVSLINLRSITEVYVSNNRVAPQMIERCEDLPLLFFARSFIVVMEEALRQLQQSLQEVRYLRNTVTENRLSLQTTVSSPHTLPEESWSSETPREDELIRREEFPCHEKEEDEK